MTLGWGIVGIGRVADTWMAAAINADPNSRIVEVVSRDQSRADAFRGHAPRVAGLDQLRRDAR